MPPKVYTCIQEDLYIDYASWRAWGGDICACDPVSAAEGFVELWITLDDIESYTDDDPNEISILVMDLQAESVVHVNVEIELQVKIVGATIDRSYTHPSPKKTEARS